MSARQVNSAQQSMADVLQLTAPELRRLIGLTDSLVCKTVLRGVLDSVRYRSVRHSITTHDIPADLPDALYVQHMHDACTHIASIAICPIATDAPGSQVITRYRFVGHDVCVDLLRLPNGMEKISASVWDPAA